MEPERGDVVAGEPIQSFIGIHCGRNGEAVILSFEEFGRHLNEPWIIIHVENVDRGSH